MVLFIEERRSRPLRGAEIEELEALALESLREIHRLGKYAKSPAIDREIEAERRRLTRVDDLLLRRAGLVLVTLGRNRYEYVPVPTVAELEALDRLEDAAEGAAPMVNWSGLKGVRE